MEILPGAPSLVYRQAPVIDLVPVRERPPVLGLRVEDMKAPLDVSLGNGWATNEARRIRFAFKMIDSFLLPAMVLGAMFGGLPSWALIVLGFMVLLGTVHAMVEHLSVRDRLTVAAGKLTWRRERGIETLNRGTVELSRVSGVRDADGHIRVHFDDGTSWEIGRGLKVPRTARRWVAGRIAQLMPRRSRPAPYIRFVAAGLQQTPSAVSARWRRRLAREIVAPAPGPTPELIEIRPRRVEPVEIVFPSGLVLRVSQTIDPSALAVLVSALERAGMGC